MRVNLRHFFALIDIAAVGRLSKAAERVHMSQSALTQALRKLEQTAGVPLFERAGFGVTKTAAGAILIRRARRARRLLSRAERELSGGVVATPWHRQVTSSQLLALAAVVETGSYSTAARRLCLAQPTLHRAVKALSIAVQVDLFQRAARGIEPTEAAKVLARMAELMFVEVRQGFEEVRELQGGGDSRIAIGSLPLVRSEFLPTAVTRLLQTYPDAQVSLLEGPYVEQLRALRYGHIDWLIGALRSPAPARDVRQQALFDEPFIVVVRPHHPLLRAVEPTVEVLAQLEWVAPRALTPARRFFDRFFAAHGVATPTRVIECSSLIATRGLLLKSDRAAFLSPLQVREDVAAGELALLTAPLADSSRTIGVTVRENWEPTRVQRAFSDILRDLGQDIVQ